jgi:hypothetical protein
MPDNDDKAANGRRKMVKRVETKEDGRFLIYYTFEQETADDADSKPATTAKAVRK